MDEHMLDGSSDANKIGIEPIKVYKVEEITYDGNELYTQSPSFNEYINNLSEKLNFSLKVHTGKGKIKAKPEKKWPWESIHEKLKNSLIEINVLSDILKITKQQQYLALDFITNDNIENKPSLVLLSKKKALSHASQILLNGADGIKSMQSSISSLNQNNLNFHLELLNLRQNWRIKKIGTKIIGDISFKSVGSSFKENGNFEIIKNHNLSKSKSSLQIIFPKALYLESHLRIGLCIEGKVTMNSSIITIHTLNYFNQFNNKWHSKLEISQNTIFCKEIFSKLVTEIVQNNTQALPHWTQGNSAHLSLFPDVNLIIYLECEGPDQKDLNRDKDVVLGGEGHANYFRTLEFALQAFLLKNYQVVRKVDQSHPTCASLFDSLRKRLSGPQALRFDDGPVAPRTFDDIDVHDITEQRNDSSEEEDLGPDRINHIKLLKLQRADCGQRFAATLLLKPLLDMGRHLFLRIRSLEVIDRLSQSNRDPLFIVHSNAISDSTHSALTINIVTKGYEALCRTSIYLQIFSEIIKVVLRDGRILWLSYHPDDLADLLISQVAQHQINAVQSLAKLMNWQTISNEPFNGSGSTAIANGGTCPTITLKAPNEKWTLNIEGAQEPVVYLSPDANLPRTLISCKSKLDLSKLPSQIFLCKVEYLMAFLKYL